MDRGVGLPGLHRGLKGFDEQSLAADRRQRPVQHFIPAGRKRADLCRVRGQPILHFMGLRQRQLRRAAGQNNRGSGGNERRRSHAFFYRAGQGKVKKNSPPPHLMLTFWA